MAPKPKAATTAAPTRASTRPTKAPRVKQADRNQLRRGWENFRAKLGTKADGDGEPTTSVKLNIDSTSYDATSGEGHAEMAALNTALKRVRQEAEDLGNPLSPLQALDKILSAPNKWVKCESKPVCYRCAIVLGLLRFQPHADTDTGETKKGEGGAGLTAWSLPHPLKDALEEMYGNVEAILQPFRNVNEV